MAVLAAAVLCGCGNKTAARGSAAMVIQSVIERTILKLEGSQWLFVEEAVGPCHEDFKPKYCSPIISYPLKALSAERRSSFRIVSKHRCPLLRDQLVRYQHNPQELASLIEKQSLDMGYLSSIEKLDISKSRINYDYVNSHFDPSGKFASIMGHYMGFIKSLAVDCDTQVMTLELHHWPSHQQ